jgi:thymidine phosphorylase
VEEGQVLADIHARDEESAARVTARVLAAYEITDEPPRAPHGIHLDVIA